MSTLRTAAIAMTAGLVLSGAAGTALAGPETTVATFDGGSNDGFAGNAFFEPTGGNPGGAAVTQGLIEFPSLRTGATGEPVNSSFLGDYSGFSNIEFSIDVKTVSITNFFGGEVSRPIGITLYNDNIVGTDGPAGVYFQLGDLSVNDNPDWTTLAVTLADPTSATLPSGWIGFGSTNLMTFEPELPAGATFASILSNVTEFHVSGAVPGFFFGPVTADYAIDNIAVTVPAPAAAMPLLGLAGLGARRRR